MKKVLLIFTLLLLCGMPLYSDNLPNTLGNGDADEDDTIPTSPPLGKSDPVEVVTAQIFNSNSTMVYQGMAYIISGKLTVNTAGWDKGIYTAYAKANNAPDRVFSIICE